MIHWWVGALAALAAFYSGFALCAALVVGHDADLAAFRHWHQARSSEVKK